ncbi:probable protein arginine N-methyltransferase 3 [Herrania umbratica]|uniref:Probable protein arginine N-methyltransferase 3 n=1 Tax=Herrania umbratica TaxID=108875 RepID=A0A6J1BLL7_9ROSI|nr:probable protein arginine N-methyltransferase 3 [Herrania umbratica]
MANNLRETEETNILTQENQEEEEDDDDDSKEPWTEEENEDDDENGEESEFLCLFCDSKYGSCDALFEHCRLTHFFDFNGIRKELGLDFYGSFKLINYVRSQVANNRCWSCGVHCQSKQDLQSHLHQSVNSKDFKLLLDDDKYLNPFMQEDSLLYSFGGDEEGENDYNTSFDEEEIVRDFGNVCIDDDVIAEEIELNAETSNKDRNKAVMIDSNGHLSLASSSKRIAENGMDYGESVRSCDSNPKDKHSRVYIADVVEKDIKKVNESYFGSYSSFGIHREMISDKVRTDAYREALLKNPSLLNGAVVMDVGCGTGILSLFAAQGGASRVIAIEASEKMSTVATQIAKDNGLWRNKTDIEGNNNCTGVIEVVQNMVENLDKSIQIQPHSVDVLVSEWMGYCLLYESMLSSVLFARDWWLKPGGAILPDTATIFVAGFGKGGTSLPFWENVYGFNMSSIGKEVVEDAAKFPIVDIVNHHDLVTNAALLQSFDLATMKPDEVDFTAITELEAKLDSLASNRIDLKQATSCYGIVLWFETGFTSRFCKETPTVLSTSPCTPKTHWKQTILTFREPIAMASCKFTADGSAAVGTDACPASKILLRISIARATQHRSIDISLETAGVGPNGQKRSWPVQMFNLS